MKTVNMHEAKTHLSKLVHQVHSGAEREIVISLAGNPVAKIVAVQPPARRELGIDQGLIRIAPDFDEPNAEITALFEGR